MKNRYSTLLAAVLCMGTWWPCLAQDMALAADTTAKGGSEQQRTSISTTTPNVADVPKNRYFIGSSAFMLMNLAGLKYSPNFYQLNAGIWLTKKDVLSLEAKTWRYFHPVGVPIGPDYLSEETKYPGYVRCVGLGVAYQRFLYKGLYAAVNAEPFLTAYVNEVENKTSYGFQLFTTWRLGYHLTFFNDRFFIEPGIAATYWPINTNVPKEFAEKDSRWPNFFMFEPGLHFGVKF